MRRYSVLISWFIDSVHAVMPSLLPTVGTISTLRQCLTFELLCSHCPTQKNIDTRVHYLCLFKIMYIFFLLAVTIKMYKVDFFVVFVLYGICQD